MKTRLSGVVSKRLALGGGAETAHELEVEIEQIRARLAANEAERKELEAALRDLASRCSAAAANYSSPAIADAPSVMAASLRHQEDRAVSAPVRRPRMTYFLSDGKTGRPPSPAMHPRAPTSGLRGYAASPRSNAGNALIKHSSRSPTTSSKSICAAARAHAALAAISWRVFIRCFLTRPAGFWPPILTRRAGRLTPWPCWRLARPRACPRPLSGLDPAMAGMCGFSSPRRFRRAPLGSSARRC